MPERARSPRAPRTASKSASSASVRCQELLDETVVDPSERYKCTGLLRTGQPFIEILDATRTGGVD
jgi:hypothetical protein